MPCTAVRSEEILINDVMTVTGKGLEDIRGAIKNMRESLQMERWRANDDWYFWKALNLLDEIRESTEKLETHMVGMECGG